MATLLADDFNRTVSGGWGTSSHGETWTQRLGATNQLSCTGMQGKIDNTTAGRVIMSIGSGLTDVEVTATATPSTSDSEIGVNARFQPSALSYYSFRVNGTAGGALIYRVDAGNATQIAGISAFTLTPGTAYDLKFRVIGSSLRAKVWQHGQAEPGTWLFDITDSTYASGGCGVVAIPQNATGVLFDDFLVTDGASATSNQMSFTTTAPVSDLADFFPAPNLTDAPLLTEQSLFPGALFAEESLPLPPVVDDFLSDRLSSYLSTNIPGGAPATWTWQPGQLVATGGSLALLVATFSPMWSDGEISCRMDQSDTGSLIWRYSDPSNFYQLIINDSQSANDPNVVALFRQSGGQPRQFLGAAVIAFTRGTEHEITVAQSGQTITVYFDHVWTLSRTDTTLAGPGLCGLANDFGSARFTRFAIRPLGGLLASSALSGAQSDLAELLPLLERGIFQPGGDWQLLLPSTDRGQQTAQVALQEAHPLAASAAPAVAFRAPITPDTAPVSDRAAWSPVLAPVEPLQILLIRAFDRSYAALEQAAVGAFFLAASRATRISAGLLAADAASYTAMEQAEESLTQRLAFLFAPAWSQQANGSALAALAVIEHPTFEEKTNALSAASPTGALIQAAPLTAISDLFAQSRAVLFAVSPGAASLSITLAVLTWLEQAPLADAPAWSPELAAQVTGQLVLADSVAWLGQLAPESTLPIDSRLLAVLAVLTWLEQAPLADAPAWSPELAAQVTGLVPGDTLRLVLRSTYQETPALRLELQHDHQAFWSDALTLADLLVLLNLPPFRSAPTVVLARFTSGGALARF